MAKKQSPRIVTPAGVAAFCWLTKPDEGHKYSDGRYKLTMVFDEDTDLSAIEEACLAAAKEEWPNVKPANVKLPFTDGSDKEDKEEFHGKTLVTLKSKFKPAQVDAKKNPLAADASARSGDLVKCAASLYCYVQEDKIREGGKVKKVQVHGVSLQLLAVQLIEKRNAGGTGGTDLFDEEDGYVADEDADNGADDDDAGADAGGGSADF